MKQNNLLQELETLFNSFTGESLNNIKDYDSLHMKLENGVTSYLRFIDTTYPLKEIASSIFAKNLKLPAISNVNDLYQSRVLGNKKRLGLIDVFSKKITGIPEFHKLMLNEVEKFGLGDVEKYLVLKDDLFIYNKAELKINAGTYPYSFLKVIYKYLGGKSGEMSYTNISNEMRKIEKYKYESDKSLKKKLQKYVTAKEDVLGKKLKSVELNDKPLLKVIPNFGIRFNNG